MDDFNADESIDAGYSLRSNDFECFFYSIPTPAIITSVKEIRILAVNEALCASSGYTRHELLGRTPGELGMIAQPELRDRALEALHSGNNFRTEMGFRLKSGESAPCLITGTRLDRPEGAIYLFALQGLREKQAVNDEGFSTSAIRDGTERKMIIPALTERLKEMTCLAEVRRLMMKSSHLDGLCKELLNHLILALPFPETSLATITLDGHVFASRPQAELIKEGIHADIIAEGKPRGKVAVDDLQGKNDRLSEKQALIDRVAEELALWLEREQTKAALHESEESYRRIIETAQEGIYIFDRGGHLTFFNDRLMEILGYSREELMGRSIDDFLLEEDIEPAAQRKAHLPAGERMVFEKAYRTKSGKPAWLLVSRSRMMEEGKLIGFFGEAIDITERKQVEAALNRSEGLFRAAFQLGPDAQIIFNAASEQILDINEQFLRLYKYKREEILGKTAIQLGMWVKPEEQVSLMKSLKKQGYIDGNERLARRKSGEIFPVLVSAKRINFTNEALYLGVIHDISDRIQSEETVRNRNQMLKTLHKTALQVVAELHLPQVMASVLEEAQALLNADRGCGVYLYDKVSQLLRLAHGTGINEGRDGITVRIGEGIAGRVYDTGLALIVNDYTHWEGRINVLVEDPSSAVMGVPLFVKNGAIGALTFIANSKLHQFNQADIQQAEMLAAQVSIAIHNASLFDDLEKMNQELAVAYDATIEGWSQAMEMRDEDTEGHTQRVAELSLKLAKAIGMSTKDLVHVRRGALLHDIGKIGIPDSILLKPGPLSEEEMEVMRQHPRLAYQMLAPISYLRPAIAIPYCHHEKWDGSGYPRGLKGEEIPLEARIFAVVDVWDALTSNRPYRPAWSREDTLNYISTQAGAHFDPAIVPIFLELIKDIEQP